MKELLFTLGYLSEVEFNTTTYTKEVNQAYWRFVCDIEAGRNALTDPALRFQALENPLKCTITEFAGYPNVRYIQDVSAWLDFTKGLKSRVGSEIKNYLNPATVGTLAIFLTLSTALPVSTWLATVGTLGSAADLNQRISEANNLWTNSSHQFFNQTNPWKAGYSVGIILTAVPIVPAKNVASSVKIVAIADKLNSFVEIKSFILNQQKTINQITDATLQAQKQDLLLNFVKLVNDIPDKIGTYELSGKSLLNKTISELKSLGKEDGLLELFKIDTEEIGNTQILKNILTDEVQAEAVTRAGKNLSKDLADGIVHATGNKVELSDYFLDSSLGYSTISKEIPKSLIPTFVSRFLDPISFRNHNLPDTDDFNMLNADEIINKINLSTANGRISVADLIGNISSRSKTIFITPSEAIKDLTASQINSPQGLGTGIADNRFSGFVEIKIDISKLPSDKKFRLPVSLLGNKNFKPTSLSKTSGKTSGGYDEWILDEFSIDSTSLPIIGLSGLTK